MASDANTKRLDCGDAFDFISNLPCNIIDLILKRLPVHDAARMSALSKTWKDIWVRHPHLVFKTKFFKELHFKRFLKKSRETLPHEVSRTISAVLLAHSGPILKFCLHIPEGLPLHHYSDTILWIENLSNNGVRKVKLFNFSSGAYKIPSSLFCCSELTHLSLRDCILTPPPKFEGFCNLISVRLLKVIITTDMSFGAKLDKLDLQYCTGIEHLGSQFKYYINLTELGIFQCGEIDCQWFKCTRKVNRLCLILDEGAKKIIDLKKLADSMPRICILQLDGYFLKILEPGAAIMKRLMPTMEALKYLSLDNVGFYDLVQIQNVICLIRISPNLQKLTIELEPKVKSENGMNLPDSRELIVASVVQYLQSPNLIDLNLNQLKTVRIEGAVDSTDLQFIKFLLASSPSLRKMKFSHYVINDPEEALRILAELVRFPRASTTAEIIWNN